MSVSGSTQGRKGDGGAAWGEKETDFELFRRCFGRGPTDTSCSQPTSKAQGQSQGAKRCRDVGLRQRLIWNLVGIATGSGSRGAPSPLWLQFVKNANSYGPVAYLWWLFFCQVRRCLAPHQGLLVDVEQRFFRLGGCGNTLAQIAALPAGNTTILRRTEGQPPHCSSATRTKGTEGLFLESPCVRCGASLFGP